jgi:hypothetical protein
MAADHILSLLIAERDKLTRAIQALQGSTKTEKKAGPDRKAVLPSVEPDSKPVRKRKLSAAGRKAIIEATKKRWEAIRAAKAAPAPAAPAAVIPKKASVKSAAFRRKMSERMKAAWAARKKKSAKK